MRWHSTTLFAEGFWESGHRETGRTSLKRHRTATGAQGYQLMYGSVGVNVARECMTPGTEGEVMTRQVGASGPINYGSDSGEAQYGKSGLESSRKASHSSTSIALMQFMP